MPIFTVQYLYVDDEAGLDRARPVHREFLGGLAKAGTLRASGPYGADGGPRGALLLVRGESAQAVRDLMAADPFATAGLIAGTTVREWQVVSGSVAPAINGGP